MFWLLEIKFCEDEDDGEHSIKSETKSLLMKKRVSSPVPFAAQAEEEDGDSSSLKNQYRTTSRNELIKMFVVFKNKTFFLKNISVP